MLMHDPFLGVANYALTLVGVPAVHWLAEERTALAAIIASSVWKQVGFMLVVFLAGLQAIPAEYYEAATIDGAGRWQSFRTITLTLLLPTTKFLGVVSVIASFKVFDQVYVMTKGGPGHATMTVVEYVYHTAFEFYDLAYASTIAMTLFVVILIFTALQLAAFGREEAR
jgi:multiple sugar transport system permease protein